MTCELNPEDRGFGGKSPLERAGETGDMDVVYKLIDLGAEMTSSVLHSAAKTGQVRNLHVLFMFISHWNHSWLVVSFYWCFITVQFENTKISGMQPISTMTLFLTKYRYKSKN